MERDAQDAPVVVATLVHDPDGDGGRLFSVHTRSPFGALELRHPLATQQVLSSAGRAPTQQVISSIGGEENVRISDTAGRRSQKKRLPAIAMDFFQSFLMHVSTAPKTVVGHGQVEDQAPTSRCVLEVVADLNVAAPLACACCYGVLRADLVSGRAKQRPYRSYHPIIRLGTEGGTAWPLVERHGIVTV